MNIPLPRSIRAGQRALHFEPESQNRLYARAQALASNPNISEMDRAALQSALMALSSFALTSSGNPGDIETIISQLESKYTNLF